MIHVDDNEPVQIGPDPDKLFVYHRQQLSAMLDGELSPDEARFMLRRLQHDTVLASCWERWQVCGDVLRGQGNELLPADFARRVALAVAGDAADTRHHSPGRNARPRIARWGGGAAIAASVALLAIFATRQLPEPGALPGPAAATPLVAEATVPPSPAPVAAPVGDAIADAAIAGAADPVAAPDVAVALAASAVALTETPRRVAERRVRAQAPAVARVQQAQSRPAAESVQATDAPLAAAVDAAVATIEGPTAGEARPDPFPMPAPGMARPWPRSLLPSTGGYTVAGGGLAPRLPAFEPFRPATSPMLWPPVEAGDAPATDARQP